MKEQIGSLLEDLDAGVFGEKIARALQDVALAVSHTGRKGEVSINFTLKRIGDSNQVECVHTVKYTKPTAKGKLVEDNATTTPLHVGAGGVLSLYPETQPRLPGFDTEDKARSAS